MRKKVHPNPRHNDERLVNRFVWWPKTLPNRYNPTELWRRWCEPTLILQRYFESEHPAPETYVNEYWEDVSWADL